MTKQKRIAKALNRLDNLAFELRMAISALQSELNDSKTVSTTIQPDFEESEVELNYTGEAVLTRSGKRNVVLPE